MITITLWDKQNRRPDYELEIDPANIAKITKRKNTLAPGKYADASVVSLVDGTRYTVAETKEDILDKVQEAATTITDPNQSDGSDFASQFYGQVRKHPLRAQGPH